MTPDPVTSPCLNVLVQITVDRPSTHLLKYTTHTNTHQWSRQKSFLAEKTKTSNIDDAGKRGWAVPLSRLEYPWSVVGQKRFGS